MSTIKDGGSFVAFRFDPSRVIPELREACIYLHHLLVRRSHSPSKHGAIVSLRHIEGERSDDWHALHDIHVATLRDGEKIVLHAPAQPNTVDRATIRRRFGPLLEMDAEDAMSLAHSLGATREEAATIQAICLERTRRRKLRDRLIGTRGHARRFSR